MTKGYRSPIHRKAITSVVFTISLGRNILQMEAILLPVLFCVFWKSSLPTKLFSGY